MKPIKYEKAKNTPRIYLDKEKNRFEFAGESFPENPIEFYEPIMKWLSEYENEPNQVTEVVFQMEYFNTASTKVLYNIMEVFERIKQQNKQVSILWQYDSRDFEIKEAGEDFANMIDVPFTFIPVNS